jgi:hypothetical protein
MINIYKTNIKLNSITQDVKNELIKEYWFKSFQEVRKKGMFNFVLSAKYVDIEYDLIKLLLNTYTKINTLDLNLVKTSKCFAYISTKDSYDSYIHNHKDVHSITAVYYAYVPKCKGGELEFYDNNNNLINSIKPKTNDFVIFDGSLNHKPLPSNSNEYRISLSTGLEIYNQRQ